MAPRIEAPLSCLPLGLELNGLERTKIRLIELNSEALSNYFGIRGHVLTPDFGIGLQTDEKLDRIGVGLDMEIDSIKTRSRWRPSQNKTN